MRAINSDVLVLRVLNYSSFRISLSVFLSLSTLPLVRVVCLTTTGHSTAFRQRESTCVRRFPFRVLWLSAVLGISIDDTWNDLVGRLNLSFLLSLHISHPLSH